MLPNRPRKDGLPVTPRPGSRPAGRSKQDESFSSYSRESSSRHESLPSSRHMRQQRSLAPIPSPRDRSGYPPMSQSPYNSSRAYESPSGNRKEPSASLSSVMSSHVSSPLNRPKSTGNASSRTSLQDDYDLLRSGRGHNSKTKEDSRQLYQSVSHLFSPEYPLTSYSIPHRTRSRRLKCYRWGWLHLMESFGYRGRYFKSRCQ